MIEVCDAIAQECYPVSTAIIALGIVLYGVTVVALSVSRRLATLASIAPAMPYSIMPGTGPLRVNEWCRMDIDDTRKRCRHRACGGGRLW